MTTTLYHPSLNEAVEVDASVVDAWTDQGWRKTKPSHYISDADAAEQASDDQKGKK